MLIIFLRHNYNTQIVQSEAVGLVHRMWRWKSRGKGKECTTGALIWQLNKLLADNGQSLISTYVLIA
ncbi:hypothetical protein A0H81_08891 [Grifola frondosa]|uniref:Uncharacterized protein n=1 Tax=Grifola frondosa TaxID=5627 RepID=A0A1C7M5A2_GRIFR|nr:hypothetical protein A0H81_08891 [Grifola frondosa]